MPVIGTPAIESSFPVPICALEETIRGNSARGRMNLRLSPVATIGVEQNGHGWLVTLGNIGTVAPHERQ